MIHSHSLGLVLDTGIVLDIVGLHYGGKALHEAMFSWIRGIAARIAPPCPHGRHVTMFVSHGVYRDYKARMAGAGIDVSYSAWHALRKSSFSQSIDRPRRLFFSMQTVSAGSGDGAGWQGDRFDRPFFALLEAVMQKRAWQDRQIIFASRDEGSRSHMRDLMVPHNRGCRVHFADDLSSCEEMILR